MAQTRAVWVDSGSPLAEESRRAGSHMADQAPREPKFFKYKRFADCATRGCAKGFGELAKAILAVQDGANLPMEKDLIPPFRMNENELSCQELTNFSSYDVVTLEKRLDSLTRPWLISLSNSGIPGQPCKRLILKPEDVGREACVMQTIVRFNHIWQERNLQVCGRVVCAKTYRIFPVAPDIGFVEFVMNSTTLQKLKRDSGSSLEVSNRCMQYLEGDDEGLDERLNQLAATTAGYLAICYLLGIGDGHGDNLMLTEDGELFRIDFGFLFGEKPKGPDAPTLWLPRTVQKALGQRLESVIEVSKDAVRAVLERPNVNFHFSVFDAAFPKPSGEQGAAQFLASLNPEDYDRQVVHIQDGSFGKAMKSFLRSIGYDWKRCSTPALTINDKSPAALVFIVAGLDARLDALVTPETLQSHVEPLVDAPHVQDVWLRQARDLFHAALLAGFVNVAAVGAQSMSELVAGAHPMLAVPRHAGAVTTASRSIVATRSVGVGWNMFATETVIAIDPVTAVTAKMLEEDRVLRQALTDMGLPTTPMPSIQEVESQYVELHHWLHPDNHGSDDLFKQVNCAYFKAKSILIQQLNRNSLDA